MTLHRIINPIKSRSFFLFGARSTGKTTFIQNQFLIDQTNILYIDLLDPEQEDTFARDPNRLKRLIDSKRENKPYDWIFIDEVQRLPRLLDICQQLIVKYKDKFILTGSSSRKLKRFGANLLAGRALVYVMFPLTSRELGLAFDLIKALRWGTLPEVYLADSDEERKGILRAYQLTYLKEEIKEEQLVRNLDPFRLFLEIAAQMHGKVINHSEIAREAGVDYKTIQAYFSILEDTYLGFYLHSYHNSLRKSQLVHPKFYFFDLGARNALVSVLDQTVHESTADFGDRFESFVIQEIYRLNWYCGTDYKLSYLLTKDGFEIDLIVENPSSLFIIKIKSNARINPDKVRRFATQVSTLTFKQSFRILWLSQDSAAQTLGSVTCLFWQEGLAEIFFQKPSR